MRMKDDEIREMRQEEPRGVPLDNPGSPVESGNWPRGDSPARKMREMTQKRPEGTRARDVK